MVIHVGFIIVLVVSCWYQGFKQGRKNMVEQMMDDGLLTPETLVEFYKLNKTRNKNIGKIMKIYGVNTSHDTALCVNDDGVYKRCL